MVVFRRRPAAPTSAVRFPSGRLGRRDRSRRIDDQCVGRGHGGRHGEPGDDGEYRRLRGGRRWLAVSVIRRDGREFTSSQPLARRAQGRKLLQAVARTPHVWRGYPLLRPTGNAVCACRLSGAVDANGSCVDTAVLAPGVELDSASVAFKTRARTMAGRLLFFGRGRVRLPFRAITLPSPSGGPLLGRPVCRRIPGPILHLLRGNALSHRKGPPHGDGSLRQCGAERSASHPRTTLSPLVSVRFRLGGRAIHDSGDGGKPDGGAVPLRSVPAAMASSRDSPP